MIDMSNSDSLRFPPTKVAVIGLGYVGLPLAVEFAKQFDVIGIDINSAKIDALKQGIDSTNEINSDALSQSSLEFDTNLEAIRDASIKILTVPTPIDASNRPNLSPIKSATESLSAYIKPQDIIVYESTVFPGVTEEICVPLIEEVSGLIFNKDFYVGYSPERLSPGNQEFSLTNLVKVVSGSTAHVTDVLAQVYGAIIPAGIHKAPNIKVAEAAKVVENVQRDLNVALMNELSLIFNRLNIDTFDVLEAAGTKSNFMRLTPGLVGGHCIGVDPYYLTYKAEQVGYSPQVIHAGRRINNGMGEYIAQQVIKLLVKAGTSIEGAKVGVFGLAFKENVSDIRNSRVVDIINELSSFQVSCMVHDPCVSSNASISEFGIELVEFEKMVDLDAVIIAVPHDVFRDLDVESFLNCIASPQKVVFDVKQLFKGHEVTKTSFYKTL